MKITTQQIRQIINEELSLLLKEQEEEYVDIDFDGWWDGRDKDYLGAPNGPVVFFDKDQVYKPEGRTHGVFSHLMTHMGDIGMREHHPYVLEHFENAIRRGLSEKYDMLYYDGTDRYPIDENFLYSVKTGTLIKIARITLDRISDDVLLGKEITDVEKEFISKARILIKTYREMVQDIIDDHQFTAVSKKDSKKIAYVKDGKIVLTYAGKISTAYGSKKCRRDPQGCADKAVGNI